MDDELAAAEPGGEGVRELARRGDVGADPLLAQQPQQGDVGKRLRPEEDATVADGVAERPRTRADGLLAEDDERRPVLLRELARGRPPSDELAARRSRRESGKRC